MVKVAIKYKKPLWWPWWKTHQAEFPTEWEQLNAEQFALAVKILSKGYLGEKDKTLFFNMVLGLKNFPVYNLPVSLLQLSDFMLDIVEPFNKVFFKELNINGVTYYGPDDGFYIVRLGEWAFADTFFTEFVKNKNEEMCNKMIACLYRPSGNSYGVKGGIYNPESVDYDGDIREKFNDNLIEHRSKIFEELDCDVKNAIIFNYRIMRRWIEEKYPNLFPHEKPKLRVIISRQNNNGWDKFIRNLCNGDLTKLGAVADLYIHPVLKETDEAIEAQNTKTT